MKQIEQFIALSTRGHRPRIGTEPRVHLSSTTVDPQTKAQIVKWIAETGATQGVVLDSLVAFGVKKGFPKKKARAVRSTEPARAQLPNAARKVRGEA
jgi:hypothetical protein